MGIKRTLAYLIDYLSISIPIMIICMMIGTYPIFETYGDYPFLVIEFVYVPHIFWSYIFWDLNQYGIPIWLPCILFVTILFESCAYSLQMRLFGKTLGMKCTKIIAVPRDYKKITIMKLFVWNIMKVVQKYFLGIPFFLMMITKKETFYDVLLQIRIQEI